MTLSKYFSLATLATVTLQPAQAKLSQSPETTALLETYYHSPKYVVPAVVDGKGPIRWKSPEKQRERLDVRNIVFLSPRKQAALENLQFLVRNHGGIDTMNLGPVMATYFAAGFPEVPETGPLNRENPETGLVEHPAFHKYGVGSRNPPERQLKLPEARRKARLVRDLVGLNCDMNRLVRESKQEQHRQIQDVRTVFDSQEEVASPPPVLSFLSDWVKNLPLRPWAKKWKNKPSPSPALSGQSSSQRNLKLWAQRRQAWRVTNLSFG